MSRITTKPVRIPLPLVESITAIVEKYRTDALARPEIERRLALLMDNDNYSDPSGAATLAALQDIAGKLDSIAKDAATAAAKGTRPSKPRTTRKTDK